MVELPTGKSRRNDRGGDFQSREVYGSHVWRRGRKEVRDLPE